jgi:hypothetical protein
MKEEKFTYQNLKDFVEKLTPEQLQMEVVIWGESTGGTIDFADVLQEDYVNESGEGLEPISVYKDDEDGRELIVAFPAGTPVLMFAD